MNIRNKFALSVLGLVGLVVFGVASMLVYSEEKLLVSELNNHHVQLVKGLAQVCEESLLLQDDLILFKYFKELRSERGFISASFVDLRNEFKAHSDPSEIGQKALPAPDGILRTKAPVKFGDSLAGEVRIDLDQKTINEFIHGALKQTLIRIMFISLAALVVGLLGSFWLAKTMVKPISLLIEQLKEVARGRLELFAETQRKDELGLLSIELNQTIGRLKELDTMKKEFSASVTHELRSPLTAIERLVSLALEETYGPLSPKLRESLLMTKNYSIRLGGFVDDLLTSAKLDSKKTDLYLEDLDAREIINEVHKFYSPIAKEKNLNFSLDVPVENLNIKTDRMKLSQVLTNLVSNAIKFTSTGSITIQAINEAEFIKIAVIDTGRGIAPDSQGKLFEKFYRAPEESNFTKGTGLGLSIVKEFLDLLKAEITVQSIPRKGSRFVIRMAKG